MAMRTMLMAMAAVALAACGARNGEPAADGKQPPAAAAGENVLAGLPAAAWRVRNGENVDGEFTLTRGGAATIFNRAAAVSAGDTMEGEVTLTAPAPATLIMMISHGCGVTLPEQTQVFYELQAGENTLKAAHTFQRNARCANLVISTRSDQAVSFRVTNVSLKRG
jgi:hypothetical protein